LIGGADRRGGRCETYCVGTVNLTHFNGQYAGTRFVCTRACLTLTQCELNSGERAAESWGTPRSRQGEGASARCAPLAAVEAKSAAAPHPPPASTYAPGPRSLSCSLLCGALGGQSGLGKEAWDFERCKSGCGRRTSQAAWLLRHSAQLHGRNVLRARASSVTAWANAQGTQLDLGWTRCRCAPHPLAS